MSPADQLDAKRFNERLKLAASYLNNLAVAVLAGAVIVPVSNAAVNGGWLHWVWIPVSAALHVGGLMTLRFLKPEN